MKRSIRHKTRYFPAFSYHALRASLAREFRSAAAGKSATPLAAAGRAAHFSRAAQLLMAAATPERRPKSALCRAEMTCSHALIIYAD